jgi:SPP1 family predicted phage head-tail adaptor
MPRLTIGDMRARLQLEGPVETPDNAGGVIRNWTLLALLWADVATLNAQQRLEAEQIGQTVTHRVTIRWRDGVSTKQRLRRGTQIFLIRGVEDPDDRRRRLICNCEEIKP